MHTTEWLLEGVWRCSAFWAPYLGCLHGETGLTWIWQGIDFTVADRAHSHHSAGDGMGCHDGMGYQERQVNPSQNGLNNSHMLRIRVITLKPSSPHPMWPSASPISAAKILVRTVERNAKPALDDMPTCAGVHVDVVRDRRRQMPTLETQLYARM